MSKNKTTNDYLNTLKDFSEQLKTQSYDGNTDRIPTYWMVQKKERIWNVDRDDADGCVCAWSDRWYDPVDFECFKSLVVERMESLNFVDADKIDVKEAIENINAATDSEELQYAVDSFVRCIDVNPDDWEIRITYYREEWRDIPNRMFLTKRDAKNYIKKYSYRYRDYKKPLRTYAYVAENSPDLTALVDALKNIDWDEFLFRVSDKDDKSDNYNNHRVLIKVTGREGEVFGIKTPESVISAASLEQWLNIVTTFEYAYSIIDGMSTREYTHHLVMHPNSSNEYEIFMPATFYESTDDAIYEWVTDHFHDTDYSIMEQL